MEFCPECQANVEGLLYRCDCCGALLEKKKPTFFSCNFYELPHCLNFTILTQEMVDALQPISPERYASFLTHVGISMVCYPKGMLKVGNIKNRLTYWPTKKDARLTITVDFNEFVHGSREEKASLIAEALLQGIHLLQTRLRKYKFSIEDIVVQADTILSKYLIEWEDECTD